MITNKKTLVYFPTVALIERCYEFLNAKGMGSHITKYHGSLSKEEKAESYEYFLSGEKKIMLATKAFGMGIDIEGIESVVHFAPTGNEYSFPQFKYLIYSNDSELEFNSKFTMKQALCVSVEFADEYMAKFQAIWSCLRKKAQESIVESRYVKFNEMVSALVEQVEGISKYKAQAMCEVFLSSVDSYRKNFSRTNSSIMRVLQMQNGETEYQFNVAISTYFNWVENGLKHIVSETKGGELYIVNTGGNDTKQYSVILGILEAMDVLGFSMIGGANSQLYIYISQIRPLQNIINRPERYRNRLLDMVSERHLISVKMLTYIFENGFRSAEIWDVLEDYFVGKIPDKVKMACLKENPNIYFPD